MSRKHNDIQRLHHKNRLQHGTPKPDCHSVNIGDVVSFHADNIAILRI
ncbi:hypothetical protein yrohd0001_34380 [Yersinia rohdei ATCC 43380]|nr:hypothetical protein yrohd0001_34380 [Yersinia rohdei ATCC 43380]